MAVRRRRRRKGYYEFDITRMEEMSHSELVEAAHLCGFKNVGRGTPADDLRSLLLGDTPPPPDQLILKRLRSAKFVTGQSLLRTVMNCDLRCLVCPHNKVIECYSMNFDVIDDVEVTDAEAREILGKDYINTYGEP